MIAHVSYLCKNTFLSNNRSFQYPISRCRLIPKYHACTWTERCEKHLISLRLFVAVRTIPAKLRIDRIRIARIESEQLNGSKSSILWRGYRRISRFDNNQRKRCWLQLVHIRHALCENFTRLAVPLPHLPTPSYPDVKTGLSQRLLPIEKRILFESGSNLQSIWFPSHIVYFLFQTGSRPLIAGKLEELFHHFSLHHRICISKHNFMYYIYVTYNVIRCRFDFHD